MSTDNFDASKVKTIHPNSELQHFVKNSRLETLLLQLLHPILWNSHISATRIRIRYNVPDPLRKVTQDIDHSYKSTYGSEAYSAREHSMVLFTGHLQDGALRSRLSLSTPHWHCVEPLQPRLNLVTYVANPRHRDHSSSVIRRGRATQQHEKY
jgi:hypothetical protein